MLPIERDKPKTEEVLYEIPLRPQDFRTSSRLNDFSGSFQCAAHTFGEPNGPRSKGQKLLAIHIERK